MKLVVCNGGAPLVALGALSLWWSAVLPVCAQSCRGVQIAGGTSNANIQRALNTHPAGTTFCFAKGTYRPKPQHAFSDRFVAYMLTRNIRIEQDLIDQLFNSTEKRLVRTLLLLARYGRPTAKDASQNNAGDAGGNDWRNALPGQFIHEYNKFRKLGFIKYNGGLHVDTSLLSVVLHE